jgi:D-glycero-D-manno-heptose 1,7-bisphosphate phosphatase
MNRAIFLDRDGVINQKAPEGAYVTRWEDMKFLPGVPEAIAKLNQSGFKVIVVSNQRCVAKGLISTSQLEDLHLQMLEWLRGQGARIDGIYYCPHEKTQPPCHCRKPQPGMLLKAAEDHHIDLRGSWMVGDSESDVLAGRRAGCQTLRITAGTTLTGVMNAELASLADAVGQILSGSCSPAQIVANKK